MKLILLFLIAVTSLSPKVWASDDALPDLTVNCLLGGDLITKEAQISYSAQETDSYFKSKDGALPMKGSQVSVHAFNEMKVPTWQTNLPISLGYGFSLQLQILLAKNQVWGDFLFDVPVFKIASVLLFGNTAISGARVDTDKFYKVKYGAKSSNIMTLSLQLENLPVRAQILSIDTLNSNLNELVNKSPRRDELISRYGAGGNLFTGANLKCNVEIPWEPSGRKQ